MDITAYPGTDTCKLGVSSLRGLAAELRTRLEQKAVQVDEAIRNLRIKVSGCFNSWGSATVVILVGHFLNLSELIGLQA